MKPWPSRREFLRRAAIVAAGIGASSLDCLPFGAWRIARAQQPARIVIIGAGLSGLVAAHELTKAGHDVIVLEAQLRPGGRVFTLREPFADGLYAEAGAARIPDTHDLTRRYAAEFGLTLVPFQPTLPRRVYVHGQRLGEDDEDGIEAALGFSKGERQTGLDKLTKDLLAESFPRLGDWQGPTWPDPSLRDIDAVTLTGYARQRRASPVLVKRLDLGLGLIDECSMLFALRAFANELPIKRHDKIDGGNDRLPAAMASQLGARIRYGSPVVRIEQDAQAVRAIVKRGGEFETVRGDYLICAIPFTVLRTIELSPAFAPPKRRAIEQLHYTEVSRVYLQSAARYWEGQAQSGFAVTDHPMEIFDATLGQPGRRGILMLYAKGALARQIQRMPANERIRYGRVEVEHVYPGMAVNFDGGVSWCWSEAPWARGAFSLHAPGQLTAFYTIGARPEGRIYLAGEHLSPWPGWMQGALASGLKAANDVASKIVS